MLSKHQMFSTVLVLSGLAVGRGAWAQTSPSRDSAAFRRLDSTITAIVRDAACRGAGHRGRARQPARLLPKGYGVGDSARAIRSRRARCFTWRRSPKPFVATAIMQLVERGKVALDSPVVRYLPYFQRARPSQDQDYHPAATQPHVGHAGCHGLPVGSSETDDGFPRALRPGAQGQHASLGTGETIPLQQHWLRDSLADVIAKVSGTAVRGVHAPPRPRALRDAIEHAAEAAG